ncbi:MAG TPA: hypothetical protein VF469_35420 [Kofleriaceae bacterium]
MTTTKILSCGLLAGLAAGCAFEPDPAAKPTTSTVRSALTSDDVDFAEECTGILTYAQFATFAELDSILPSNVANAIVAARAGAPFNSIADRSGSARRRRAPTSRTRTGSHRAARSPRAHPRPRVR